MQILKQLIEQITDGKTPLTDIFINAKVLAFKLKNNDLSQWIDHELNGYVNSKIPEYRVIPCQVMGTVSNGAYRANSYPIPVNEDLFGKELCESILSLKLGESITSLEQMTKSNDDTTLSIVISPDMYGYFSRGLSNGYVVEYANRQFSKLSIVQTLTSIKSKLIDLLLKLDEEIGDETDVQKLVEGQGKQKVEALFQGTVFGNNTTFIVGDNNRQTVTNTNIQKGSFEDLEKLFSDNEVDKKDIQELKVIIDEDNPNEEKKQFGNKVQTWMQKMLAKSMDTSWKVGIGAAGKLLADGIMQYYGWK